MYLRRDDLLLRSNVAVAHAPMRGRLTSECPPRWRDLLVRIESRLERSDLASWRGGFLDPDGGIIVLYRKRDDPTLYGQVFDSRFFDGFEGESMESLAATIVANEIEPPHEGGEADRPVGIDMSNLPQEPVRWVF
jgi:hypothetical protein